jgi:hypothetical protein
LVFAPPKVNAASVPAAGLFAAPNENMGAEPADPVDPVSGGPLDAGELNEKVGLPVAVPLPAAAGFFFVAARIASALKVADSPDAGVCGGGVTPNAGALTPKAKFGALSERGVSVSVVTPKPVADGLSTIQA